jgi:transcriptional regulator
MDQLSPKVRARVVKIGARAASEKFAKLYAERNAQILSLDAQGISGAEIGRRVGLTRQAVNVILKRLKRRASSAA